MRAASRRRTPSPPRSLTPTPDPCVARHGGSDADLVSYRVRKGDPRHFARPRLRATVCFPIWVPVCNAMKIRNIAFVATLVAASVILAPVYGPEIRAYAQQSGTLPPPVSSDAGPASPGIRLRAGSSDDLGKDMKTVASAYALIEKNFADPVVPEKAFYQGAIPGHAAHAGSALQLRRIPPNTRRCSASSARSIRRGHGDRRWTMATR